MTIPSATLTTCASGISFFISSACLSIFRPITAPVTPPATAPIIAPNAVLPATLPTTAPAAAPPAVPITAPFCVLFMLLQPVAISEKQIDPINNCFDRVFIYYFVVQQQVAKYHAA